MKVVGAGFSRTGTFSLKRALEAVGFGPCYHMDELFRRPDHWPLWTNAARVEPDWRSLFAGDEAAVDAPACHFWRSIRRAHPGAKVILTVRAADAWYESFFATVYQTMTRQTLVPAPARPALEVARRVVLDGVFGGRFEDRDHAIAVYEAHNRDVVDSVDARDLLVYRVADGWAPLCEFLSVEVPAREYPMTNARGDFRSRVGLD
jgi:hypothetical protein